MLKSKGLNESEKYLIELCEKSFLSMWSYGNIFYSQSKELADLLIICGNDIIIFQDKVSLFQEKNHISLGWSRWFRNAVYDGAKQAWRAERLLKNKSTNLYLDPSCKTKLQIAFPSNEDMTLHLIVVAHGGSEKCKEFLDGSGSFMINSGVKGIEAHTKPFIIGDLDESKTFVHVLDDTTLKILIQTLDTITDFISYLSKKEVLLRSEKTILAAGEEELLANYLKNFINGGHNFSFGYEEDLEMILIDEGGWNNFANNPQRLEKIKHDRISYAWDDLIELFARHASEGTQYLIPGFNSASGIFDTERIIRFMAKETRFARRVLISSIKDMLSRTRKDERMVRVIPSFVEDRTYYVFLLFPIVGTLTYDQYREVRLWFLQKTCMVVKNMYSQARHIVGIATESGLDHQQRSEDAIYLDASIWSPEMSIEARRFQNDFDVLKNYKSIHKHYMEYPSTLLQKEFSKNPRNKKCPCGGAKKYKKCHGK